MSEVNKMVEASLIGGLLYDGNEIVNVAGALLAEDFEDDLLAIIYAAMLRLFAKSAPIEPAAVAAEAGGSSEIVDAIAELYGSTATAAHVKYHVTLVRQASRKRKLVAAGNAIAETAGTEGVGIVEAMEVAQASLMAVAVDESEDLLRSIDGEPERLLKKIEEARDRGTEFDGLAVGLPDVDSVMQGLKRTELILIAARPSVGKTALMLNWVRHVLKSTAVDVLLYSLEMRRDVLLLRMIAIEAKVEFEKLRRGDLGRDEWMRVVQAANWLDSVSGRVLVNDSGELTPMQLRVDLTRERIRRSIGLVCIDYLQLMSPGKRFENRVQEVSHLSRTVKMLAMKFDVPIVALSQLSRAIESRSDIVPNLSDLRESGSLEQDSDAVVFLARDVKSDDPAERMKTIVRVAKNRNGRTATIADRIGLLEYCGRFVSIDQTHQGGH